MKFFFKLIFALIIGFLWYRISADVKMSVVLALFVFLVLLIRPMKSQALENSEEYIAKMREKKERKMALVQKQKEEIAKIKRVRDKIQKIKGNQS